MWISLARVMYSSLNLCHVHFCMLVFCLHFSLFSRQNSACVMCAFKFVLCAVCSRWLAASRLATRFARVARFASQAAKLAPVASFAKEAPKLSCQQVGNFLFLSTDCRRGTHPPLVLRSNFIITFNCRIKIKWPQKGVCRSFYRILRAFRGGPPPEGGQNSIEWSAYPFCGHFILILQLNVIIKFDRRTKGGWVPLLRSVELS